MGKDEKVKIIIRSKKDGYYFKHDGDINEVLKALLNIFAGIIEEAGGISNQKFQKIVDELKKVIVKEEA